MPSVVFLRGVSLCGTQELRGEEAHQVVQAVTLRGLVKINQAVSEKFAQRVLCALRRAIPHSRSGGKIKAIREGGEKAEFLPQIVRKKLIAGLKSGAHALLNRGIDFLE